ncbi:ERMES complex subunit MMM1 NDAI_0C02470 [Naumovozyma dairenensis CBS 421]|uniref:Maintenance of mitochondrial morphology protein 1 n=1 Tax=Naumovozyma dairenensis (strain ATCC 10597 / BCRC 20456 / CBS 421 / NBRC 0211 / NRRL Y-12639) TaxID=1071378 RepID=G0W7Z6_NAUDC|nr:hypothetical protein NDAI_0C02470 [Naumovozyma dairenensis CBS 421]CCD23907.1 hypothetical protein NDAI_0C02470 [Naumovozyma dairenensis CBS 421]
MSKYSVLGNDSQLRSSDVGNMLSLDEYINKTLPLHLKELLLDNLKKQKLIPNNIAIDEDILLNPELLPIFNESLLSSSTAIHSPTLSIASPSWSFAQGFIIGQISIIMLLIFFIKFFIFSDTQPKDRVLANTTSKLSILSIFKRGDNSNSIEQDGVVPYNTERVNDSNDEQTTIISTILEKTYYDVTSHDPESLDWFNVLIAQIIEQFRNELWLEKEGILNSLNEYLNTRKELSEYLGPITITEIDIGSDFPIFSNCRVNIVSNSVGKKNLQARIDIDLNDRLAFGLETNLVLNFPRPSIATLPIKINVAIIRFQGCLNISLTTAEEFSSKECNSQYNASTDKSTDRANESTGYYLVFSFSPEYTMEFDIHSMIGSRSKLENIPKISSLIEYQIKKWFVERCVEPRFQFVKLPNLWPRSKNTREEKTSQMDAVNKENS